MNSAFGVNCLDVCLETLEHSNCFLPLRLTVYLFMALASEYSLPVFSPVNCSNYVK